MRDVDGARGARRWWLALAAIVSLAGFATAAEIVPTPAAVEYNRDIRPILMDACISCHGPDSASRQADLRLDRREDAIDYGAIVPGDAVGSEMIRRIESADESEVMPPPEIKKTLTAAQIDTLKRWIAQGAEYQPHWSFIPPTRPDLPEVANHWWGRNAIDSFVAARLEAAGLTPAPEADRSTLLRRVTLDLTGLPPTPDEVEAFLRDTRPDAYERVVDRLLASPRWGEHRGRYWLDVARYGDTHGIHIDNYREIWPYRDWVFKAFNQNMPFDEFTRKNLAGDLLPGATLDDRVASGFNRCNITTSEGGAIDEEYAVLYTRDRTETTATAWMGLTAGCAVCHDHKFDPLSQKEFYELSAFFNNTTQRAMDGNVKDTPPVVVVYPEEDRARVDELSGLITAAERGKMTRRDAARPGYESGQAGPAPEDVATLEVAGVPEFHSRLDDDLSKRPYSVRGEQRTHDAGDHQWHSVPGKHGRNVSKLDGSTLIETPDAGAFDGNSPYTVAFWMHAPHVAENGAMIARFGGQGWDVWWEAGMVITHLVHEWPTSAIKVRTKNTAPRERWTHVAVTYDGSRKATGMTIYLDGVPQEVVVESDTLQHDVAPDAPLRIGARGDGVGSKFQALMDVRVYDRLLTRDEVASLKDGVLGTPLALPIADRTPAENEAILDWWLSRRDVEFAELQSRLASLQAEQEAIRLRNPVTHVMQEQEGAAKAFVLNRGEYDQRLDEVSPATPGMLPPMDGAAPRNRLGLADWLLRPDHPLTARVTVNRFWQEVFGVGLVKSTGDFGVTGELPSDPELLDWLAVEFRESGWDVKRFYRLLVTSAAYRQSAVTTPAKLAADPDNRLVSRGPRRRMDAEMIRDQALAASGLLVERLGGPSVRPYQPDGIWESVTMPGSDTFQYRRDSGEALYRRSVYTFWKRSAPPASLETFNAPSRESCTVARERTNTPMQAMVTLNDVQFVEAARVLAERVVASDPTPEGRLRRVATNLLGRDLQDEEAAPLLALADGLTRRYTGEPDKAKALASFGESPPREGLAAPDVAAWTMVASSVMNLDEALCK
jgi:cytochrome c553